FAISAPLATVTGLTADRGAPQAPGTTITFTATATSGTAPYQYKWYVWRSAERRVGKEWCTSATYAWTPTTPNVNYRLQVWVRSSGNTVDLPERFPGSAAVYRSLLFAISAPLATVTGLTADRGAPQAPGTTITFTATATSGTAPYQYKWYVW